MIARDEILPELGTEGVVDSITFIWRFLLHPEARSSCAKAVVSDIARYVGNDSILTTWHNMLELPDSELVDMGFSNVGGTELIFISVNKRMTSTMVLLCLELS